MRKREPTPRNDGSNSEHYAEGILAAVSQPIVVLTGDLLVERVNAAFCETFDVAEQVTIGTRLYDLGNGQWDIPELRRLLQEVLTDRRAIRDYTVDHSFERIGRKTMRLNARLMGRAGVGDRIVLAIDDVTELKGRKEFAEKLVDSVREGLLILGWDLRVHSANQSFYEQFRVSPEATEGRTVYELGNGQWDIPELRTLLEQVLRNQTSFNDFEVEHEFEELGRRVMLLNGRKLDHLDLIILAIRDVTDRRSDERRQAAFMAELQHRVKNILNNVRSLAHQTRRRSADLDQFFDAFGPRLAALARSQDLLLKSPGGDIELCEIVRVELEALGAERGLGYTAAGPSVRLSPRDTQAVALAVHELATNAGKYGALAVPGGRVAVDWRTEREELHFRWREHGVRIGAEACPRGFGSDVIEKSVPHLLGGSAELTFHPDGAECRIAFPLPGSGGSKS